MPPLNLLVHADSPENGARIAQALTASDPTTTVRIVSDHASLPLDDSGTVAAGLVATASGNTGATPSQPSMPSALRHELNNHLGIIRMLADYLLAENQLPFTAIAKVRDIGTAAEAAAQALRRTKPAA